jgi:hypothetical protein
MTGPIASLKTVLQLERRHVGDMGLPVHLDQFEHGIDRGRQLGWDHTGNGAAGCNGEETAAGRIPWREHGTFDGHLDCSRFSGCLGRAASSGLAPGV